MHQTAKPPGSVVGAAVLLMIYGGMSMACVVCAGASFFIDDPDGMNDKVAKEVPSYVAVEIASAAISIMTGLGMIVAGLGVLKLMRPARLAAYFLCVVEILQVLAHCAYSAILVIPAYNRIFALEAPNMPELGFNFANAMSASMWVGVSLNVIVTLVFCTAVIVLLSKATARAAFATDYFEPPPGTRPRYEGYEDEDDLPPPRPPEGPPDTGITGRPG